MSASAYDKIGLQVTQDSCGHDWLLYAHMHMRDDLVYVLVFPFTLACIHLNDILQDLVENVISIINTNFVI